MLATDDIKLLIQAERNIFSTKEDLEKLREDFSGVVTSIDGYAKKADNYFWKWG